MNVNLFAPSGTQITIVYANHQATVVEVGGGLRTYAVNGRDVVMPYPLDAICPESRGAVLAPWPNRLADGRYTAHGITYQLPVTEPSRNTALHGLVAWQRWTVIQQSPSAVTVELALPPQPGYPFDLLLQVTYSLSAAGLRVDSRTRNRSDTAAPFGIGFHPWLSPGVAGLDDCSLQISARSHLTVDDRLLPTGIEPDPFALRHGHTLAGCDLDDAFCDVERDDQGRSWAILSTPENTTRVWMDEAMTVWQVCTGDHLPARSRRRAVAVEPMSCPADAFRSGDGLVWIAPGGDHTASWGITQS